MLVLSRKMGEEIVIAGVIRVRVIAMDSNKVRLGIVAPANITIDREEIHNRRMEFQQTSTTLSGHYVGNAADEQ